MTHGSSAFLLSVLVLTPATHALAGCSSSDAAVRSDGGHPSEGGPRDGGVPDQTAPSVDGGADSTSFDSGTFDGNSPFSEDCTSTDAGPPPARCPNGAPENCVAFTPVTTGANACGENATTPSWALTPTTTPNGKLVLFFNGSGGHPGTESPQSDPTRDFYDAATALGYYVLAISYPSNESIGDFCNCADGCFFPSRQSVILGRYQSGAAPQMAAIQVDEGIAGRTVLALTWLAHHDAGAGWQTFLTSVVNKAEPEKMIEWSKVVTAGHSQGGGHAAACGKMFSVDRVIQLSSTCDVVVPSGECSATEKDAAVAQASPASWTSRSNGTWATPASSFYGLDRKPVYANATFGSWVSGDGKCFIHPLAWQNMGMLPEHEDDDGGACDASTQVEFHQATIGCAANYPVWTAMLQ